MQLVTLTTDWGYTDHYIGQVKGRLYSTIPDCQVIDITHNVPKFNMEKGAFIVRNTCFGFPPNTIHIIDVSCSENSDKHFQHIVVKCKDQYFICTDNGMPSLIFNSMKPQKIIGITNTYQESNYYTFSAYDLFCKVAAIISYETPIEDLGFEMSDFVKRKSMLSVLNKNNIQCCVFYVDSYGNAFLNITIDEFLSTVGNNSFRLRIEQSEITEISKSYDDVKDGEPLLTVSSTGHLQIAMNKDSAVELLGCTVGRQFVIDIIKR